MGWCPPGWRVLRSVGGCVGVYIVAGVVGLASCHGWQPTSSLVRVVAGVEGCHPSHPPKKICCHNVGRTAISRARHFLIFKKTHKTSWKIVLIDQKNMKQVPFGHWLKTPSLNGLVSGKGAAWAAGPKSPCHKGGGGFLAPPPHFEHFWMQPSRSVLVFGEQLRKAETTTATVARLSCGGMPLAAHPPPPLPTHVACRRQRGRDANGQQLPL